MILRLGVLFACVLAPLGLAQDSPDGLALRRQIGQGVRAYRSGQFAEAARLFEKAVAMDPTSVPPRLYLGTSYEAEFVPGSNTPENLEFAQKAEAAFLKALELEPDQETAIHSIANLAYQRSMGMTDPKDKDEQLERAAGWYRRAAESSPTDKVAFYMVGVVDWTRCEAAGAKSLENTGPIPDLTLRAQVRAKCDSITSDGMAQLKKAIEVNPNYDQAMSYLSLLAQQRATFADSQEAWRREMSEANDWSGKAIEARKRRAQAPADSDQQ